jgi:hypothetical protein
VKLFLGEFLGGFYAPGGKCLIGVVMVMVVVIVSTAAIVVVMIVVVMIVVVMIVVVMIVVVMIVVVVMTAAAIVVVMVVIVVMTAATVVIVMVVIVVMTAATVVVVMIVIVVMTAATIVVVMVVIVVMVAAAMMLFLHLGKETGNGVCPCHRICYLRAGQLFPRGGNDGTMGIYPPNQLYCFEKLVLVDSSSAGENDRRSGFNLVIVKLTEVTHIALYLGGIGNGYLEGYLSALHLFHGGNYVRQLAHTGRLNDDSVGGIVVKHLRKRFAKVAYQAAADAAGVHFPDFHTRFLQKAAVNADFAKFVLNQHDFLTCVIFFQHFGNQSCLTGTQKAGININFCHKDTPSLVFSYFSLYHFIQRKTTKNFDSFPLNV